MTLLANEAELIRENVDHFISSISSFVLLSYEEKIDAFSFFLEEKIKLSKYHLTTINFCFQTSSISHSNLETSLKLQIKIDKGEYLKEGNMLKLERFYKIQLRDKLFQKTELEEIDSEFFNLDLLSIKDAYVKKYALEMVHAFENSLFNASSVMMRKLIEILIILVYESSGRATEIKDGSNFLMLKGLIQIINNDSKINLGRDCKDGLIEIKKLGDKAAHNRRYFTRKKDLTEIKSQLRLIVEELNTIIINSES